MPRDNANQPTVASSDHLARQFRASVAQGGDQPAYVFLDHDLEPSEVLSFAALGDAVETLARRLAAALDPGDRILLAFHNQPHAVQLFWACVLAGMIPVPAPAPEPRNALRLTGLSQDAGVALGLCDASHVEAAREQIAFMPWTTAASLLSGELGPRASPAGQPKATPRTHAAYLQYTSGSTSAPRGVVITHGNVMAQRRAFERYAAQGRSRGLIWLPWFHDYGLVHGVVLPLLLGCVSYLMPTGHFMLRPLRWLDAIGKYRITHTGAPDFAYQACVRALERTRGWTGELGTLQMASCGAEPVRAATLTAFADAFAPFGLQRSVLTPCFGLAEAVLAVTLRDGDQPLIQLAVDGRRLERMEVVEVPPNAASARVLVGCGRPLPGFDVRIVDPDTGVPCPTDRVGEIWIAGAGVAPGYWGHDKASDGPFGARLAPGHDTGQPHLRTGDLGFLRDGQLFVAGRRKDLIIIGGRNLYPQDLELSAEQAHDTASPHGTIAVSVDTGSREAVVLLVECTRRPTPQTVSELIRAVRARVASEHQVDVLDVVALRAGTLPRTSSGKPRRSDARRLYLQGSLDPLRLGSELPAEDSATPPAEQLAWLDRLAPLWAEVLGTTSFGTDDNFFNLGGDSLSATQLVARIRSRHGIDLPIQAVFERPTLRAMAEQLGATRSADPLQPAVGDGQVPSPATARPPGARVSLSFSQERMWFMHELAPDSSAYNMPLALRFRGDFRADLMETALRGVIERHESLRTRFVRTADGVVGEVIQPAPFKLNVFRPETSDDDGDGEASWHRHLAAFTAAPFQLDQPPLLRACVVELGPQDTVLLIVMHHTVGDQWSFAVMGRELAAHYNASLRGTQPSLPALSFQHADHAAWHRQWFAGAREAQERDYWVNRLAGLHPLPLNEDFPRPRTQQYHGSAIRLPLSTDLVESLRSLAVREGASLSMVLMAAINVLLFRHTGKEDIGIGVPIANRNHVTSEHLIGTFVNTLVLRTALSGDLDFTSVLARVRAGALEAFAHQDMPFELLVRALGGRPDSSRSPLFNVMFNMVNSPARDCEFDGLSWQRVDFDRRSAQFDLTFVVDLLYDHAIVIEYATDLFRCDTIERMAGHLRAILHSAIERPNGPVQNVPLLSLEEAQTIERWSLGPTLQPGAPSVLGLLRQAEDRHADREALVCGADRLTYRALHAAADRLARRLSQQGIGRGSRVGLCLPRGAELLIALLAVIKSGAAYVPLDPAYPRQRIQHQIDDARLVRIITSDGIAARLGIDPSLTLPAEATTGTQEAGSETPLTIEANPEDPAYMIYTSGSTGVPKGVVVPHRALVNFLASMAVRPGLSANDRLLAVTTPGFDIAVLELLLPLTVGATVVMASDAQAGDGQALAQLILEEGITVFQATPSRWHLLIDGGWQGAPRLKGLVGGEPLTRSLALQLQSRCADVWNMYGPTETTVWSSCWQLPRGPIDGISLGSAVANTSVQVLDNAGQPSPIGVPGEIWIGGTGVALGYYLRPELTAERFVEQPDAGRFENRRIYRTGDLGRWRADGSLEHLGRLDDQVKLRGFRLELGEIEANLLTHPSVSRAVVSLREEPTSGPALVAYVVPRGAMPSRDVLRDHLRQTLPDPMVPSVFVAMTDLPVLPNGKTDRRALPAPQTSTSAAGGPKTPPRNATEQAIWNAWSEVLDQDRFGVHDNFFDLGGHSLQAVRIVGRIEQSLGVPCPLPRLLDHPTVADLARALTTGAGRHSDVPLTRLQATGSGPALFLLAGAEMYRHLARELGPTLPVYGVFSQTEIDILEQPEHWQGRAVSVETLATEYLALLQRVQPTGPYFLGGFSIGGVLAYAVAQRLQAMGERVGLIVLLDSMLPGKGLRHFWLGVLRRGRLIRRDGWDYLRHAYAMYRQQRARQGQPGGLRNQIYAQAIRQYNARPGNLPMLFLQAGDDTSTAPAYGWQTLVPGLQVVRVPGRHMDILDPPNVATMAERIRESLKDKHPAGDAAPS